MSTKSFPQASHDFIAYNHTDTAVWNHEPSLTRQEFAEECDINALMARYNNHVIGGPGNLAPSEPMYFDFADMPQDLMGYMQFMEDCEKSFMSLPAIVRKEFDNSALEFVAFASDPTNLQQMRDWGLAPPAKVNPAPGAAADASNSSPPSAAPPPSQSAPSAS
ncbi:MAG: internal scaffolding protein [Microviridae sp.]|nr:MAG: internal scaffolding protein [Microviridae sp.]